MERENSLKKPIRARVGYKHSTTALNLNVKLQAAAFRIRCIMLILGNLKIIINE